MTEQLWTDEKILDMRIISGLTDGEIMHKIRDDYEARIAYLEAQLDPDALSVSYQRGFSDARRELVDRFR